MFIDGKWTNAHNQETFASYNPANAELLGEVPLEARTIKTSGCFSSRKIYRLSCGGQGLFSRRSHSPLSY